MVTAGTDVGAVGRHGMRGHRAASEVGLMGGRTRFRFGANAWNTEILELSDCNAPLYGRPQRKHPSYGVEMEVTALLRVAFPMQTYH